MEGDNVFYYRGRDSFNITTTGHVTFYHMILIIQTDWEEWEGMEVKIEPTTLPLEEEEVDLFQDMQPVIHSTKKVCNIRMQ